MLAPNVIIEGVRGIGKTLIWDELQKFDYIGIMPNIPVSIENTYYRYTNYFGRLSGTFRVTSYPFVFDGGHLSELVYGTLHRPQNYKDGMLKRWLYQLEGHLIGAIELYTTIRPAVIIYLEPVDLLFAKDSASIIPELAMFEVFVRKTKLPIIRIKKHSKQPISQIVELIMEKLNER